MATNFFYLITAKICWNGAKKDLRSFYYGRNETEPKNFVEIVIYC